MFPQLVEIQSPPVYLVDDGGEDANVTVFYGTVDAGLSSMLLGGIWSPKLGYIPARFDARENADGVTDRLPMVI